MVMNISITRCIMWAAVIGLTLGLIGALSGCGNSIASNYVDTTTIKLHNGRHVDCAVNGGQHGGTGISCDWDHSW